MGNKQPPPDVNCKCDKCGAERHAPPGKPHRKCVQKPKGIWRANAK